MPTTKSVSILRCPNTLEELKTDHVVETAVFLMDMLENINKLLMEQGQPDVVSFTVQTLAMKAMVARAEVVLNKDLLPEELVFYQKLAAEMSAYVVDLNNREKPDSSENAEKSTLH